MHFTQQRLFPTELTRLQIHTEKQKFEMGSCSKSKQMILADLFCKEV